MSFFNVWISKVYGDAAFYKWLDFQYERWIVLAFTLSLPLSMLLSTSVPDDSIVITWLNFFTSPRLIAGSNAFLFPMVLSYSFLSLIVIHFKNDGVASRFSFFIICLRGSVYTMVFLQVLYSIGIEEIFHAFWPSVIFAELVVFHIQPRTYTPKTLFIEQVSLSLFALGVVTDLAYLKDLRIGFIYSGLEGIKGVIDSVVYSAEFVFKSKGAILAVVVLPLLWNYLEAGGLRESKK